MDDSVWAKNSQSEWLFNNNYLRKPIYEPLVLRLLNDHHFDDSTLCTQLKSLHVWEDTRSRDQAWCQTCRKSSRLRLWALGLLSVLLATNLYTSMSRSWPSKKLGTSVAWSALSATRSLTLETSPTDKVAMVVTMDGCDGGGDDSHQKAKSTANSAMPPSLDWRDTAMEPLMNRTSLEALLVKPKLVLLTPTLESKVGLSGELRVFFFCFAYFV